MIRRLAGLLLLSAVFAPAAGAVELDRGDLRLEFDTTLTTLFTFTRDQNAEDALLEGDFSRHDSGMLLERLRLNGEGVWRDRIYAQLTYDNEVRTGSGLNSLSFRLGEAIGTGTWFDWDHTISDHEDANWRHLVYRAWVRYEAEDFEVTVGRQRIPLGRTRLWNPIDLFNPIPPLAIDGGNRIGQDAIRVRGRLAQGLWSEAIWAPQNDPDEDRAALRVELFRTSLDAAVMVGSFERDWVFGGDAAFNVGDAAFRTEATWTNPRGGDDRFWQVVASLDYTFSVGSGLYCLVEHLFNENNITSVTVNPGVTAGSLKAALRLVADAQEPFLDRIVSIAKHQTALQLGYDVTPLLRADLLTIYDWNGASVAIFPVLSYSLTSDIDVSVGGQLFVGKDAKRQYGDIPALLLLRLDAYF